MILLYDMTPGSHLEVDCCLSIKELFISNIRWRQGDGPSAAKLCDYCFDLLSGEGRKIAHFVPLSRYFNQVFLHLLSIPAYPEIS